MDAISTLVQPFYQHRPSCFKQAFEDTFTESLEQRIALDASGVRPQLEPV